MKKSNLTSTLLVDQTPEEVFHAINNVRGWWSKEIEGGTDKLNDEFTYRYKDMHYSKQRIIEMVPNKKIVWLVLDSQLTFIKKQDEWTGTKVIFDIVEKKDKTEVLFTHLGLTPDSECFDACTNGWNHYLQNSLINLIAAGTGSPNDKESKPSNKVQSVQ